jgi:hypothetical protein
MAGQGFPPDAKSPLNPTVCAELSSGSFDPPRDVFDGGISTLRVFGVAAIERSLPNSLKIHREYLTRHLTETLAVALLFAGVVGVLLLVVVLFGLKGRWSGHRQTFPLLAGALAFDLYVLWTTRAAGWDVVPFAVGVSLLVSAAAVGALILRPVNPPRASAPLP